MGSAAPLVQPDEPGQTVPGVAPSSKFTKSNGAPVVDVAAYAALPSERGEWTRVAGREEQDASQGGHAAAKARNMDPHG